MKIAIVGCSGAGKSTLAQELSKQLSIPVYHLDLVLWTADWGHLSDEEFEPYHRELINKPDWIIDGVVSESSMKARFSEADCILFMDVPVEICKARARKRLENDKVSKNPFMAEGCRYADVEDLQLEVIDNYDSGLKPLIVSLLDEFPDKNIVVVNHQHSLHDIVEMIQPSSPIVGVPDRGM